MHIPLRRVNEGLFGLILAINLFIIAAPFLPRLNFWWQHAHTDRQRVLVTQLHTPPKTNTSQTNHLIVPAMLLDTPVQESSMPTIEVALDHGVVHVPTTSTPDKGSNTVIIGHRFSYTAPEGIFYYMDKLHPGDEIGLVWNNKTYTYKVASTRVVPPTQISVEAPTPDARLTLYTCTPLWNPVNRLVVVAELEHES